MRLLLLAALLSYPAQHELTENLCTHAVYQGLIPWAWIEASTKGAVLLFAAAEIEGAAMTAGIGPATAGLLGGMGGGVAQAYATVGASRAPLSLLLERASRAWLALV